MTSAWCLRLAAVSGFLVVALGAFGAHGLKTILQRYETLETWQTAVFYHALHTLALLALSAYPGISKGVVISFVFGILVFSGSLYLLAVTNVRWAGRRDSCRRCRSAGRVGVAVHRRGRESAGLRIHLAWEWA